MTPEERAALHAAMYQPDEESPPVADANAKVPGSDLAIETAGQTTTIRVGVIRYNVPSIAYVTRLENENKEMHRRLLRAESAIKQLRAAVNSHSGDLSNMDRELARKINLRDMP